MKKTLIPLIFIFLISVVLCVLNFVLLLNGKDKDVSMLVATIVSGWVSGFATFGVGIISLFQAKKYNDLNNNFLKKQFQLEQSKTILQSRLVFVNNVKQAWHEFNSACNPIQFAKDASDISNTHNPELVNRCIMKNVAIFHECYDYLNNVIQFDYMESKEKLDAIEALKTYQEKFFSSFNDQQTPILLLNSDKLFSHVMNNLCDDFAALSLAFNKYLVKCDFDINANISHKSDDIEYLNKQYSPIKDINK